MSVIELSEQPAVVLIITVDGDDHAAAVTRYLSLTNTEVWTLDTGAFPRSASVSIQFEPNGSTPVSAVLQTEQGELPLESVKSVWLRRNMLGLFAPRDQPNDVAVFLGFELEAAFRGLMDVLRHALWVNWPGALYAMEAPITQLSAAKAEGLLTPATVVTTTERALELTSDKVLPDAQVKVLIAGEQMFAFESVHDAHRSCRVPKSVEASCRRLMRRWSLRLGCFSLDRTTAGYMFQAFTANPDWLQLELATGLPVTAAVADLLLRKTSYISEAQRKDFSQL